MATGKLIRAVDNFHLLDALSTKDTPVHRLHPISKIVVALLFIMAVVSCNRYDIGGLCPFFAYPILLSALGEIPLSQVLRRTLPALPFVLFAGLSNVLFDRDIQIQIGALGISNGVISCVVLVEKTVLSVSAVLLLSATTQSTELLSGLQRIGMPRILTTTCMLCFRYLSLLMEEAGSMMRAYHLRSGREKGIEMRDMGSFAGQLLLRSADKAARIYSAMQCRGFTGSYTVSRRERIRTADILYPLLMGSALAFLRFYGWSRLMSALLERGF